ncbi:hypothetical protein [Halorubrum sp. CSM-61]|uniref:hypothetical protein n=1 Tax=Halorubrum sp. CSM-61 TaxID=2485838 RepID=UPI000F4BA9E1|nr:hypothetical protein [Halorubrum sp. CSM-61]
MRAAIFTEGSMTTNESAKTYSKYFGGSFLSVKTIVDALSSYCEIELHILSEDHGYVRGESQVERAPPLDFRKEVDRFTDSLSSRLEDLDVVILLFTADTFEEVIVMNWDRLVKNAKRNSIWCIGTSRSALNSINIESLEQDHTVLLYQRRGVARLGTGTRDELIEHIQTRADD